MTSEESEVVALDAYIRRQLAQAGKTYASGADIDARLEVILASGEHDIHDGTVVADSE